MVNKTGTLEEKFDKLADEWFMLAAGEAALDFENDKYRELVALGKDAIPLILKRYKNEPLIWWSNVLNSISNENPVPHEIRGYADKIKDHWLAWGRQNGYLE